MSIPSQYLRLRSAQPYITTETTPGSYVAVSAGDAFTTVDPLSLSQTFNTTDISEVGSRLLQNRSCLNYAERATYDMTFLVKPSGSAGTAPAEDALLQKIFGTKTVSAGTSVAYSFSRVSSTFQVAQIVDTYMLAVGQGTIIEGMSLDISRTGVLQMTANARSSRVRYSGPCAVSVGGTIDDQAATSVTLTTATSTVSADYFFNGMLVDVFDASDTLLNTGPVTVSAVSSSASTLSLLADTGDSFTLSATDYLVPYLPSPTLSTYESLCPGTAQLYLGTQNAVIGTGAGELFDSANEFLATGFSLNVSKNLGDPGINELTGDLYPSAAYVSQNFDITGSFEFVMRPAQVRRFEEFARRQQIGIGLQIGDTSGRIIRIAIPSARVNISMTDQDGAAAASVDWSLTQGSSTTDAGAFSLIYL